ncbi:MAG: hypothetical protein QW039_02425 [Fervidicoccaceae archaeon]
MRQELENEKIVDFLKQKVREISEHSYVDVLNFDCDEKSFPHDLQGEANIRQLR